MVSWGPPVELTRLYPRWCTGVVRSPQVAYQVGYPLEILTCLKQGLLHRGGLVDLFGTNYPGQVQQTQLTWVVWSYHRGTRYLIQTLVGLSLPTSTGIWPSASWFEREIWEMLGVRFPGHSDLRRLLTDYGFQGFPLQKSFPVVGYQEVRFSERSKRVVQRGVQFTQEFRTFDFGSPWQS